MGKVKTELIKERFRAKRRLVQQYKELLGDITRNLEILQNTGSILDVVRIDLKAVEAAHLQAHVTSLDYAISVFPKKEKQ